MNIVVHSFNATALKCNSLIYSFVKICNFNLCVMNP